MSAIFGPAGNADNYPYQSSIDAPGWLSEIGLDCYEYQCGRGVRVSEESAQKLKKSASEQNIILSLHAPYFINLANPDGEAIQKNTGYIVSACRAADAMGASRVVIHSGALMKRTRAEALEIAMSTLKLVIQICDDAGYGQISLCPETMGKINQLGDLDEVLELCALDERLIPCIDFGHLFARSLGADNGLEAYINILDRVEKRLGAERADHFHSHFSQIEFTKNGGEKRHLPFPNDSISRPEWEPLAQEIARRGWNPTFICESAGTQATDALTMKKIYQRCLLH